MGGQTFPSRSRPQLSRSRESHEQRLWLRTVSSSMTTTGQRSSTHPHTDGGEAPAGPVHQVEEQEAGHRDEVGVNCRTGGSSHNVRGMEENNANATRHSGVQRVPRATTTAAHFTAGFRKKKKTKHPMPEAFRGLHLRPAPLETRPYFCLVNTSIVYPRLNNCLAAPPVGHFGPVCRGRSGRLRVIFLWRGGGGRQIFPKSTFGSFGTRSTINVIWLSLPRNGMPST